VAVDVRETLTSVRELIAHAARDAGVTVAVEVPDVRLMVRAEPSELTQILVNLAMNAIEAMAAAGGGVLTLRASAATEAGGLRVVVAVADTGPGIPSEALARIWEAFYTTKPEGTGLGLSIVAGLVAKQPDGRITVHSQPGGGATFRLTLPLAA
jgi:signal transduction histidine kinase